ncbi:YlqD family protein [Bacillus sp. PS06]|uniref:YlqD family protein n=1 Tax=Bacillus sp. PS06 TaxID=2764176 RepID=UPI0017818AB6|nr:YlqD family protein [Bacillus sp. PS06]MBD8068323.1 YlqD family protein [Bacillus sp. PS06]
MHIIQTVIVKQILTENSKASLIESFQQRHQQLTKEIEQLKFERKKFEKNTKQTKSISNQFIKEMTNREEKLKLLDFQINQIHMLPLGSEIKDKEVQGLIEVKPGDKWDEAIQYKTIIVKDGIIQEIR